MLTLIYVCSTLIFSCLFYMLVMTHLIEFMIPEWIASCSLKTIYLEAPVNQGRNPFPGLPDRKSENWTRSMMLLTAFQLGNHILKSPGIDPRAPSLPSSLFPPKTPPVGIKTSRTKTFSPRMFYFSSCIFSLEMGFTVECYFAEIGRVNVIPCSFNKHYSM